jgi:long-chain acyl-CoA synthetase
MTKAAQAPWLAAYPEGVDWFAALPEQSLPQFFDAAVARFGANPFVDFLGRKYSYREIAGLVARAAKGLQDLGVAKGTRVGLFLPNSPYFVICYYAILKAGGTVVNFNPLYAEAEIRHLVEDSGAEIMITLDLARLYPAVAPMLGRGQLRHLVICRMAGCLPFPKNYLFPVVKRKEVAPHPSDPEHVDFAALIANDGQLEAPAIDPRRDIAVLQYTGGTTGIPKGAMLTHFNLVANAIQCRLWMSGLGSGHEKVLAVLPFFHVFAMTACMNHGISIGAELIILPRFELDMLLKTIDRKKPTIFHAVPTIYTAINNCPNVGDYDLSSIKACISGGAPLPLEVKSQFERLTGCRLVEGYGMSESSPVATCGPLDGRAKAGSVGLPVPGTRIEIVDIEDPDRVLPIGEKGEVCIIGPQVMAGYWNKPEETAAALRGGRLHTGDVGHMDAEGYTYLVDRIKDMILCGGYNVYPRNVEEAIYQHPAVGECVVIGIPDPYRGQSVKAFIAPVTNTKLIESEILEFLRDKLSAFEMPKEIEFRAGLPKTAVGKLSKKALIDEENARRSVRLAAAG